MATRINWQYQWARKFSASRFEIVLRVFFSDYYKEEFGVEMKNSMIAPVHKNHAIYHDPDEWNAFASAVYNKATASLEAFRSYEQQIKHDQEHLLNRCISIAQSVDVESSLEQLSEWYEEYQEASQNFFNTAIWIPFIIEPLVSQDAKDELGRILEQSGQTDRFQELFDAIFSPEQKNAVLQEREAMLKIVSTAKDGKLSEAGIQAQIEAHSKNYQWIPCYDIMDAPWSLQDFKTSFQETFNDDVSEEQEQLNNFQHREERFEQALNDLNCTEKQKALFTIAHEIAFLKDERDDFRRKSSFTIQPLFNALGERMGGLTLQEAANLLSTEVRTFFQTTQLPPVEKIQERVDGYVLIRKNGSETIQIFSGSEADRMIQTELAHLEQHQEDAVQGTVGSPGTMTGPARLVITKHDLRKVEDGDVMIAVTTHPDFVPAMRRCAAIVTDEGGITSHAAIVSRELGIPCIVGTMHATSILKDGDQVFVDAEKGIVRKQQ